MSKRRIIVSDNPLEPSSYSIHEDVPHVASFIMERFPSWPDSAHIYSGSVSQANDVTPHDEASIARLEELEGDIFIIVYPEGIVAIIILVVVLVAAVVLLKPKVPDVSADMRNQQAASPNNELSARTNQARIASRIPDIYGTVRSTPDLIMETYNYYENNRKVEITYMCIGRGYFAIHDAKDGDTHLSFIPGSAAQFYLPNQSPNSGHSPFYTVGSTITDALWRANKLEQVVGQEMRPPNSAAASSPGNFKFQYPDRIYNNSGYNFSDRFQSGDQIVIAGATYSGASDTIVQTAVARYVWNGGAPYVEWQSGDPRTAFAVGDSLIISNASTNGVIKTFTTTFTGTAKFTDTGRIDFSTRGSHPIEDGDDFRTGQSITVSNAIFTYNFADTYNYASKSTTKLFLVTPALTNGAWNNINGSTGYQSMSIGGITRTVRFNATDSSIELQTGNFSDMASSGTVVVSGSGSTFTTNLNGTYTLSSVNNGGNYWTLSSPSGVNAEWDEINGSTGNATITITQTHAGDTQSFNPAGTFTISALTATRITLSGTSTPWTNLQNYVNDRTEYDTNDTFTVTAPVRTVNLNGTYTIVSVGMYEIIVSNPNAVSADWAKLDFYGVDNQVIPSNATIETTDGNWIGPFYIEGADTKVLISNFVAQQGLYTDDGKAQARKQVEIEMLSYLADDTGNPTGAAPTHVTLTMTGSAIQRDTIANTMRIVLPVAGPQLIYARRITAKDTAFTGTVVDQVKWEEVYALAPETKNNFGAITTVMTKTYATGGALAIKERKFNCLVTRKIPYITGWTGTYPDLVPVYDADLQPTRDAWQIFCAMSLDPFFGARDASELDFYNIAAASTDVYNYFGEEQLVREFSYTFDNTNISYEEAAQAIANVNFCTAYRQGSKIKWKPEIATMQPILIFNHRNKVPDTETRSIRFGAENGYDSIQMDWVNPADDSIETFFIPEDQSGSSTKKIDTIGIRNRTQATYHAWRAFYKMKFQNTVVEFESTQEAAILISRDPVMVADNTRADVQDGEVLDQEVLQLTLSQAVHFDPAKTYTVFLQHADGYVESIPCTAVPDNLNVLKNVYALSAGGFKFQVASDAGIVSVGDIVTVSNCTITDPANGSCNLDNTYTVVEVDGANGYILFDNPGSVDTDWTRLSVEQSALRLNVRFESTRDSKRKINLTYAPAAPLNLDPMSYARATYMIRANDEAPPATFQVTEIMPKDNFTYRVSLANYDARVYYLDDLEFWLNFDDGLFHDASARGRNVNISSATGKATIAFEAVRGSYCFANPTNSTAAWVKSTDLMGTRGSYTKAFWIKQGAGFDSYFLSNAYEQFRVNNTGRIIAGHDSFSLSGATVNAWPSSDGNWHHACCTYDADAKILSLYIDGVKKGQRVNSDPPTVAAVLQPIGVNSSGVASPYADDVRYWKRCFSEQQVAELYRATR